MVESSGVGGYLVRRSGRDVESGDPWRIWFSGDDGAGGHIADCGVRRELVLKVMLYLVEMMVFVDVARMTHQVNFGGIRGDFGDGGNAEFGKAG